MKADPRFANVVPAFWANVRSISQTLGYTDKVTKGIKRYSASDIQAAYAKLGLSSAHLFNDGSATEFGSLLLEYFAYRADILERIAEPNLMDYPEARVEFDALFDAIKPRRPLIKNKQKGEKAGPQLLTGMVNMLWEQAVGSDFNGDPTQLTTITRDGLPVRTLARRVDGAFPSIVNPLAIWEIKEYYFTTTFGSRVADGVYETLLDGLELQELRDTEGIDVKHFLIVDSKYTWWSGNGRGYLCRMVDMLHMGLVDEVLFGREVVTRLPAIIADLVAMRDAGLAGDHPGDPNALDIPRDDA